MLEKNALELNSTGLYESLGKEEEYRCLVFPSSTKREIRRLHVVVVQRGLKEMYQKSVIHVQSCCFANLNRIIITFFGVLVSVAAVVD